MARFTAFSMLNSYIICMLWGGRMSAKRKSKKKAYTEYLTKYAVKIKCCYCELGGECQWRAEKENLEAQGVKTKCTATPNRPAKPYMPPAGAPSFEQFLRSRERYNPSKEVESDDRFSGHKRTSSNPAGNNGRVSAYNKRQRS